MKEKRKFPREQVLANDAQAFVQLPDGRELHGKVHDVSEGGARIDGETTGLSQGDQVDIIFLFPSGEKVKHNCQIRHVDSAGKYFGIEYHGLPEVLSKPEDFAESENIRVIL